MACSAKEEYEDDPEDVDESEEVEDRAAYSEVTCGCGRWEEDGREE